MDRRHDRMTIQPFCIQMQDRPRLAAIPTSALGILYDRRSRYIKEPPMPVAVSAADAASLPPARMIDPRGHRFGAGVSAVLLIASLIAFVAGATLLGWILVLAVAALQSLLAITGYCLGCRLYFLRWWVPSIVTGLWRRQANATIERTPLRYS